MRKDLVALVLAFFVAYVLKRALEATLGFHYSLFSDPFSLGKLVVDVGTYGVLFLGFLFLFKKLMKAGSRSDQR